MTNTETYYGDAAAKPSMLDRVSEAFTTAKARTGDSAHLAAEKLREPAMRAASAVRSNPAPYLIGAGIMVVFAGLLMNRRSREAGLKLAEQALSKVRH